MIEIEIVESVQFKTILLFKLFTYSQIKLFVQINMENFLFNFTQKKPSEFLIEQRAKTTEQRVKSNEQRATSEKFHLLIANTIQLQFKFN